MTNQAMKGGPATRMTRVSASQWRWREIMAVATALVTLLDEEKLKRVHEKL